MNGCSYPSCMMGGMGCPYEKECDEQNCALTATTKREENE